MYADQTLDPGAVAGRQVHRLVDAETAVRPGPHVLDHFRLDLVHALPLEVCRDVLDEHTAAGEGECVVDEDRKGAARKASRHATRHTRLATPRGRRERPRGQPEPSTPIPASLPQCASCPRFSTGPCAATAAPDLRQARSLRATARRRRSCSGALRSLLGAERLAPRRTGPPPAAAKNPQKEKSERNRARRGVLSSCDRNRRR